MEKHLAQLKTRRLYSEQIASERAAKEAEAEETEKIRVSQKISELFWATWSAAIWEILTINTV